MSIIEIHYNEFSKRGDLMHTSMMKNMGIIKLTSKHLASTSFDIEYNSKSIHVRMASGGKWKKEYNIDEHMVVCKIMFFLFENIKKNIDNIYKCFDMLFDDTIYEGAKIEYILDEISKKNI